MKTALKKLLSMLLLAAMLASLCGAFADAAGVPCYIIP